MNRFYLILVLTISLSIYSCRTDTKSIDIKQNSNLHPTIIRLTKIDTTIFGIRFSNSIKIENNSFMNKSFIKIRYKYNDSLTKRMNFGIELYEIENEKLKRISNNGKKIVPRYGSIEYIYYTRHFIDSSKAVQQQFKPYIKKMLEEGKDTLHIGTVTEFKMKHKELFDKLIKNDSISIRFYDGNKLGKPITTPIEW